MTKEDKVVARAMELIGPTAKQKYIERAVGLAEGFIKRAENYKQSGKYGVLTQDQKEATLAFVAALARLRVAVHNTPESVKVGFPLDEDEIDRWQQRVKASAETQLLPPLRRDPAKESAAKLAGQLLRKHGLPLKLSKGSQFCRLAALLYEDEAADLRRQCTAYKRVAGPK